MPSPSPQRVAIVWALGLLFLWSATATAKKPKPRKRTPSPPLVRLPKLDLKRFDVKLSRPPQRSKKAKTKKRLRPPTREGRLRRKPFSLRSKLSTPDHTQTAATKQRRRSVSVRHLTTAKKQVIRLVVYRRQWGRSRWSRRWLGHIFIRQGGIFYLSPRPTYERTLRKSVRAALRTGPRTKRITSKDKAFAWKLRRFLERKLRFEVDTQFIPRLPRNSHP